MRHIYSSCDILPQEPLRDEIVDLCLIRVVGPNDIEARPVEAQFLCRVPEYRFIIHRRSDGLRVGRIHLRFTNDEAIVLAVGHAGYEVEEAHRRQGYAVHALRLIIRLSQHFNISPLWVLIEPDNIASRRTAESAGFQLVDTIDTLPEAVGLGIGPRVCRYVIKHE